MPDTPLVTLHNVGLEYGSNQILSNVSLTLSTGKVTTIIGPNGAGKTSLVKIISGLVKESSGTIARAAPLRLGYMPQKLQLNRSLPIKVGRFLSLADKHRQARHRVLERLEIMHLNQVQMHNLSGGELQRVLLARAILRKPNLLVLDEPLQGVDITGQMGLYQLISALRDELHCAVVMVSHDLHLVMAQTDAVICLNRHVCCHGKPESVSKHPEYLRLFGRQAAENLAIYTHDHDHHHNLHGDAVNCGKHCDHD